VAPGPPHVDRAAGVSELLDLRNLLASRLAEPSSESANRRPAERFLPLSPGLFFNDSAAELGVDDSAAGEAEVGSTHRGVGGPQGPSATNQAPYVAVFCDGFAYMAPSVDVDQSFPRHVCR